MAVGERPASIGLDLGRSLVLAADNAATIDGFPVGREALHEIAEDENKCFEVVAGDVRAIAVLSGRVGWVRSLFLTADAPATLVAGFPMHRIKDTTPLADVRAKVRALGRPKGWLLDTATDLGCTAIELARISAEVVTVELDPAAIDLARRNPWSARLFSDIRLLQGDVSEAILSFEGGEFGAVLHDPPALQLAGELCATAFYAELQRVLESGGRPFHYVGDPRSGMGASTMRGAV